MLSVGDLPYFDLLLEGRRRGEPAAGAFERFVHWGYWEGPPDGNLAAAAARLDRELRRALAAEDGQAVLDAGCGFGGSLAELAAELPRARLAGLNLDGRQLAYARSAAPRARFVQADACRLPFADAAFDRVLAVECIFHFPSRQAFLREAARVLKPGGRLALSDFTPGRAGRSGVLGRWVERRIEAGYGRLGSGWPDGGYAEMAAQAGLRVLEDRDVTRQTLPTYPALLALLSASPAAARLVWPTRLLGWVSRAGFVRYRILSLEKPA